MLRRFLLPGLIALAALALAACGNGPLKHKFTVTVENLPNPLVAGAAFTTPEGAGGPAPALPGDAYAVSFAAQPGDRLSFATMYVQSNDLFFAPAAEGLALYDAGGDPVTGDVTDQVLLWDAGTEVNEAPGSGPNQAPRQSGPNTGPDEFGTVRPIAEVNDGYSYPAVGDVIAVTLSHAGGTFTLRIEVQAGSPSPIAPGFHVVHTADRPLFTHGAPDYGEGLEALAEDGVPSVLAADFPRKQAAFGTPLSPGAWAVHVSPEPIFTTGEPERGNGLEAQAEDGNPSALADALGEQFGVVAHDVFDTPTIAGSPGPAVPGDAFTFSFTAVPGLRLSLASMFGQSNDLFFAVDDAGLDLFDRDGNPVTGDVTAAVDLWDAGTEVNELPGAGAYQAPRQPGPNTGPAEGGVVQPVAASGDGFIYPDTGSTVRVTVTAEAVNE